MSDGTAQADVQMVPGRLWLRALVGLCLGLATAAALWAYLGVSQRELLERLHDVTAWPLAFAAAGSLVLMGLQSLRWWMVMRPVLPLSYGQAYRAMAVGFFFNVLLPARGGDLLRVQYLGKRTGISRAKLLGTEIVDFWSDKWGWVATFPLICLLGSPPAWLFKALLAMAFGVVSVGGVLALMASGLWRSRKDGLRWGPKWLLNLRDGFAANQWKRLLLVETLVAPLPWIWETFLIAVASHAVGLALTPMQAFAVLTAFNIATAVPSPGNAGSFEGGGTFALLQFHVDKPAALAFIVLYHLTQVVPGVCAGLFVLVMEGEALFGKTRVFRARAPALRVEVGSGIVAEPDAG